MIKYTSGDNTFKYFIIGILIVATLLIVGIISLTVKDSKIKPRSLPTALEETNVNHAASMRYGNSENEEEYFVYFYSPNCGHCQVLMQSAAYQNFIKNPKIRMYKINVNETEGGQLASDIGLKATPTVIYIKKVSEGKYIIDKMPGSEKPQKTLINFTN
ncbi:thioredoxin family protein [Mycoplasmatota bacterium]|nr:thioredoxin family protein [Mycoplasmatota bacterium]